MTSLNTFGTRTKFGDPFIYRLDQLAKTSVAPNLEQLPFSIRILLESLLRNEDGYRVTADDIQRLAQWNARTPTLAELPFMPARVIMQDFTGGACLADLAAMRDAVHRLGHNTQKINPLIPVDLVIDHTVIIDYYGTKDAAQKNTLLGYERNRERYEFFKWGSRAFKNFRVVPPATGIIHQVNLEYLAQGVIVRPFDSAQGAELFPDTVVGTDSHTPMINGLGVVGWGVGGIEAEAVMLGQPVYIVTPQVIGFKLSGTLRDGVTATDLVLTVTQMLRQKGVVDKFVEFFGPGLSSISLPDRATMANMAPEYGATMGFFPTDEETVRYLRHTGRAQSADLLERYAKEQGLFRTDTTPEPIFTDTLELNLAEVELSVSGPKKPEQRVAVRDLKKHFHGLLTAPTKDGGYGLASSEIENQKSEIRNGSVVIAAITSCTNTSNPSLLIGAGLLAKKAVEKSLTVKTHVKTSLSPGSQVVTEYLDKTGLTPYLETLGFFLTGYGCAVCVGNSGPLPDSNAQAITEKSLVATAVLSGNRNFEGRIHPLVRANFLASPPLVVAYALAGTIDIDLENEPLGIDRNGEPVFLCDVLPSQKEIAELMTAIDSEMFAKVYANVFDGDPAWNALPVSESDLFPWDSSSTYLIEPPFVKDWKLENRDLTDIRGARVLALLGDGITTDHISPVGSIPLDSPTGKYLIAHGVAPEDFNQYGTRRGNHEVMMRGAFANIRLKNWILGGEEGGHTLYFGPPTTDPQPSTARSLPSAVSSQRMSIFAASKKYKADNIPLIVIAGKEYGTGSSRDWAAKAPALIGVKAILTQSFERIHRSNLVGMGILPLQFKPGENAETFGLTGREVIDIHGISNDLKPRQDATIVATDDADKQIQFQVIVRLDTPIEIEYYKNGGILPTILRNLLRKENQIARESRE
ncbi:MAG: aconitate hydratase AcnA [Chloroflexi bacterium]|nr:aconitate hydratase AcnA [Chloroflexota bacterium]